MLIKTVGDQKNVQIVLFLKITIALSLSVKLWINLVFWETAPYPFPKPTLKLPRRLGQNVGLGEG